MPDGNSKVMRIRKVVDKSFAPDPESKDSGTNVAGHLSAVIAANVGESGESAVNHVSSSQRVSIVQRGGKSSENANSK